MAVNLNITQLNFFNELRNGVNFNQNLTDFTTILRGNVNEKIKVNCKFDIEVVSQNLGTIHANQLTTKCNFTGAVLWFDEGFDAGASIEIKWNNGANVAIETITSVTNVAGGILQTTNANLLAQGLTTQDRTDFEFRLLTPPNYVWFKYGINELSQSIGFNSPLDNNEQSFWGIVNNAFTPLTSNGNYNSWVMGDVEMKHSSTVGSIHTYVFNHIFTIPYFKDSEINNLLQNQIINDLIGNKSYRYDFGLFMSPSNFTSCIKKNVQGITGNVGWFNENFNGFGNNYQIQNLTYTNTLNTQTLEATLTNTVTFELHKLQGNFNATDKLIIKHSKLPNANEYSNSTDTFDTIWMRDQLKQIVGGAVVNGNIITNLTVTQNVNPQVLDVSFDVTYTTQQQSLIETNKYFLLNCEIEDSTIADTSNDRVNLIAGIKKWSKDTDTYGIIINPKLRFFKPYVNLDTATLGNGTTDFSGWDAEFVGCKFEFEIDRTIHTTANIQDITFRLIAFNQATNDWFEIDNIPINISTMTWQSIYQLANINYTIGYFIPNNDTFNNIKFKNLNTANPQKFAGQFAFKTSWRDWISNLNVNPIFYDNTKPNNNLNKKTSNYSSVNNYDVYGVIDLTIRFGKNTINNSIENTIYRLISAPNKIFDFDINPVENVIATTKLFDLNGNQNQELTTNTDQVIEIEFRNLSANFDIRNLYAEIIIEEKDTQMQEDRLCNVRDWTNPINKLQSITNNGLLDVVVVAQNIIKIRCKTNSINLIDGVKYNIYGHLTKKDPIIV